MTPWYSNRLLWLGFAVLAGACSARPVKPAVPKEAPAAARALPAAPEGAGSGPTLDCRPPSDTPVSVAFDPAVCPTWLREPPAHMKSMLGAYDVVSVNGQPAKGHFRLASDRAWIHLTEASGVLPGDPSELLWTLASLEGVEPFTPFFHPRERKLCSRHVTGFNSVARANLKGSSGGWYYDFTELGLVIGTPRDDGSLELIVHQMAPASKRSDRAAIVVKRSKTRPVEPSPSSVEEAIERGTVADLSRLLDRETTMDRAWLIQAIEASRPAMVELLLRRGAALVNPVGPQSGFELPMSPEGRRSRAALSAAAETGDIRLVERLLKAGADRDSPDTFDNRPLAVAVNCEGAPVPAEIAEVLAVGVSELDDGILECAVKRPAVLARLLCNGLDPSTELGSGYPLLDQAVREGTAETVKLLLAAGAESTEQRFFSAHTLTLASKRGDPAIVGLLIDSGARIPAGDPEPLLDEVTARPAVLRELLRGRVLDPSVVWNHHSGGLHLAAQCGRLDDVALLLDLGAPHAARDSEGRTPRDLADDDWVRELLLRWRTRSPFWHSAARMAEEIKASHPAPPRVLVQEGEMARIVHEKKNYWLDRTEVTVAAYRRCVEARKCTPPVLRASGDPLFEVANYDKRGRDDHPVNDVTHAQAAKFCAYLGKRLPTAEELMPDDDRRPWGTSDPSCRRVVMDDGSGAGCGRPGTWPVGSKPLGASPEGILDLAGNVSEWVAKQDFALSSSYEDAGYSKLTSVSEPHPSLGFRCAADRQVLPRPR
jgi:ankyrin repeat protein